MRGDLHVSKGIQWHQLKFNAYISQGVSICWLVKHLLIIIITETVNESDEYTKQSKCECQPKQYPGAVNLQYLTKLTTTKQCWRQSTQQPAQLSAKTTSLNVQNMKTGAVYRDW